MIELKDNVECRLCLHHFHYMNNGSMEPKSYALHKRTYICCDVKKFLPFASDLTKGLWLLIDLPHFLGL